MKLFNIGRPVFLGIDFGTASIKAAELTVHEGEPTLTNYGTIELARLDIPQYIKASFDEKVVIGLRAITERLRVKNRSAYVAMPAFIGLMTVIEFPEISEDELEEAIRFEAHKYIPSSLDDVALSWEVVGRKPGSEGKPDILEILLVAALNKEVQKYEQYVKKAELDMELLELETFSIVRSVVGKRKGLFMVIDIGFRATNLIFVENGSVKVSRNLDVGGKDLTRTIMESLSINQERAETLKKSGKDFLNQPASALTFPALEAITYEARRMLTAYSERYPGTKCEGVLLSGGSARFTGITDYFSKALSLHVEVGNPWERIIYKPEMTAEVTELGGSFSVALGLALSGVDAMMSKESTEVQHGGMKKLLTQKK